MTKLRVQILTAATALTLATGLAGASAQDEMAAHPAHIHTGTCDELGDVVFPLTNVSMTGMMEGMMGGEDATPMTGEMGEMVGAETAMTVLTSATVVDAALEDILAEEHAINLHESEENIEEYIACGDIGGMLMGPAVMGGRAMGEMLVVGLQELNDSGYAGIATLEDMGEETMVTVYLAQDRMGGMTGDDAEGTPTSS